MSGGKFRARRLLRDALTLFRCQRCYQRVSTLDIEMFRGRPTCSACRAWLATLRARLDARDT